jgi:dienelactone hydrolase
MILEARETATGGVVHCRIVVPLLALCVMFIAQPVRGQSQTNPLPRRGYFGVGLEKNEFGVRVFTVTPGSTAAEAEIAVGDILEAVDGQAAVSPEVVVAALGRHKSGESVKIALRRNDEKRTINATLKPYPTEQMANAEVQYGSVTLSSTVRLRTILSIPRGQPGTRYPAVLLLQGGGCGSIDAPFSPTIAQPGLMHTIGSQGFVTMRVEKSGVGDSEGPPCETIGYNEELSGYQAALNALRSNPSVDESRVYLLGISLGGVFAPLLGAETKVAGISVFGTLAGPPPQYPGRSDRFFQEFAGVDVAGAWSRVATRVQILHGEYDIDPQTNGEAQERIARSVAINGTSRADFRELRGLDHCWTRHPSLEASKDKCGMGETTMDLSDAILAFLRAPVG